jgi:hypothetical protein
MSVSIDPRKAHLSRVHGDVTAIYTWIKVGDDDIRALVLAATYRPGNPYVAGAPIYVIQENLAHAYDDPVQLAHTARAAAKALGLDDSSSTWFKIASIIHEGIPDLIRIPHRAPEPEYLKGNFGHMQVREAGRVIAEEEIRIEAEGPTYGAV